VSLMPFFCAMAWTTGSRGPSLLQHNGARVVKPQMAMLWSEQILVRSR